MKKIILSTLLATLAAVTVVAEEQPCESSSRQLYKEIIVFKTTEQLKPNEGFIGKRLDLDLKLFKNSSMTLIEKVHSLEVGFAKCYLELSQEEELQIQSDIELFNKAKNPLITE